MAHRTFSQEGGNGGGSGSVTFGTANLPVGPAVGGILNQAARADHQHPILTLNGSPGFATLDVSSMPDGTPVFLASRDAVFTVQTTAQTVDGVRVFASTDPARQWLRRIDYSQKWSQEIDWAIDTATGNDDNTGRTGSPLKTMDECVCRTWQAVYPIGTDACTVKLTGNMSPTDSGHFNVRGNGSFPLSTESPVGYDIAFQIIGQPVSVGFAGVMTGVQNGARGSLLDIHFTDAGIPVSFTASGFLARNLIYKRTNGVPAYFWPVADLGTKTLRISQPNQIGVFGAYPAIANNDTYVIMTLPSVHDIDFPPTTAMYADYSINLCYDVTAVVSAPVSCPITKYGYSYENPQQSSDVFVNCQLVGGANLGAAFTGSRGQQVSGCVRAAAGVTNSRLTVGSAGAYVLSAEGADFTTFQGCQLTVDIDGYAGRLSAMFFDVSVPIINAIQNAHVDILQIGGAGCTSKIFSNVPCSSIGYDNLPNAGMTTDALPYRSCGVSFAAPTATPASLNYQGTN